jgi:hypothetical protein
LAIDRIEQEIDRGELVNALRDLCIILLTARPAQHRAATLESIKRKTGWNPRVLLCKGFIELLLSCIVRSEFALTFRERKTVVRANR